MRRALLGLPMRPAHVSSTAIAARASLACPSSARSRPSSRRCVRTCIGAASILAKVTRDRMIVRARRASIPATARAHKGYGTPAALEALRRLGPSPCIAAASRRYNSATVSRCALEHVADVTPSFVHLHLHTEYSLVDSVVRITSEDDGSARGLIDAAAARHARGCAHRPGQPVRAGEVLQGRAGRGRQAA